MAGWQGMALPSASLSFLKTLDVHFVHTQRRGTGSALCPRPRSLSRAYTRGSVI